MSYKWEASPFKSPMARARGVGSAHSGVHHWINQKATAIANIPLVLWAVWSVVTLAAAGPTYEVVTAFFVQPVHAVLMILFLISTLYHAALGLQVVVEDYIHCEASKMVGLIVMKLVFIALGVASVFSILRLAF